MDDRVAVWVGAVLPAARAAVADQELRDQWLVCEGTWFVGVDALPNDQRGAVAGSGPVAGHVWDFIAEQIMPVPDLHRAQLSVVWPGYPRPRAGESEAGFRYRSQRDAAHVDGLRAEGPDRRRYIREPHAFILGLPLTKAAPGASPLVVWEGSHQIMRAAFKSALAPFDPSTWVNIDLTDVYQNARQHIFETCRRIEVPVQPGEAILLHRLSLHGVAPWRDDAPSDEGRMIAYFRPEMCSVQDWINTD